MIFARRSFATIRPWATSSAPPAIEAALTRDGPLPVWTVLRGPETGLVMVRGRAGGSGPPFNLGEMTVTRCTVRLASGVVGHAYIAGRNERQAELAAVADALLQDPALNGAMRDSLIRPLADAQREQRLTRAEKAAATRVEFFAMRNMRS